MLAYYNLGLIFIVFVISSFTCDEMMIWEHGKISKSNWAGNEQSDDQRQQFTQITKTKGTTASTVSQS